MNRKIKSSLLVVAIIFTVFLTSSRADELPILPNKTFWLPIAPHSIQTIITPFSAIDIDSTYQITVTKALPAPYKSKICLHQTCVQNSLILDSIPANTKDELQMRVYSDEITAGLGNLVPVYSWSHRKIIQLCNRNGLCVPDRKEINPIHY